MVRHYAPDDLRLRSRITVVVFPASAGMLAGTFVPGGRGAQVGVGVGVFAALFVVLAALLERGLRRRGSYLLRARAPSLPIPVPVAEYLPKTIWVIRNREPALVEQFLTQSPLLDPAIVWDTFALSTVVTTDLLRRSENDLASTNDALITECLLLAPLLPVPVAEEDFVAWLNHFRSAGQLPIKALTDVTLPVLCAILTLSAASASLRHLNRRQLDVHLTRLTIGYQRSKELASRRPASTGRINSDTIALRSSAAHQLAPRAPVGGGRTEHAAAQCVWADLLRLTLASGGGRIEHHGIIAQAARGALLIDLARNGLLTSDDTGLHYTRDSHGVPLADELISDLENHPRRTLAELLQRGRPHLDTFTDVLINSGVWTQPRLARRILDHRLTDCDADTFNDAGETLTEIATGRIAPADPHHAILAALAVVLNLTTASHRRLVPAPEVLLIAAGDQSWILRDVTTHLYNAQLLDLSVGATDNATNIAPLA